MAMGSDDVIEEDKEESDQPSSAVVPVLSIIANEAPLNDDVTHNDDDTIDDLDIFDEDDAAVFLEELAINFGISARNSTKGSAAILSVLTHSAAARNGSLESPRSLLRSCLTKVLVQTSLKTGKGAGQIGRLLSAKRNHINNLSNDIVVLQRKIKELEDRNRVLVRITKRQESALKRYHDAETQVPHLLEAHKMEIKILQDKLRKALDLNKKDSEKLKDFDHRLTKLTDKYHQLKEVSQKKNLPERDTLSKKLTSSLSDLQEKQNENLELSRRILILNKSFKQQIVSETNRHKTTLRNYESLQAEHERTLRKLSDVEKQLASLQLYRSRSVRNRSSSCSSSTATSVALDLPGAVSSGGSCTRRLSRKCTVRKLKQTTLPSSLKNQPSCIFDNDALIDLDIQTIGWTTECKINTKKRRGSGKLPRLNAEFQEQIKKLSDTPSTFSSENISSPDEFISSDNHSHSHEYQTSSVAIQDSTSRKTTILSSWSDETQAEDISLSRSNSPPTTVQHLALVSNEKESENICNKKDVHFNEDKIKDVEEEELLEDDEDSFFDGSPCPEEDIGAFSLIENYPPKERKKLGNETGQGNSSVPNSQESTESPEPTSSTPVPPPPHIQPKTDSSTGVPRGTSATNGRKSSLMKRRSSLITAEFSPLFTKSSGEHLENKRENCKNSY